MGHSTHVVGQRVSYDGALCTVRYIGEVAGTAGSWLGVEWDDASRGKHEGSHKGTRYFKCLSRSSTAASFVRPTRPADKPLSFVGALNAKYAAEALGADDGRAVSQIVISGKVAQEIGFDKIRGQLARVKELKIVILDGMRVASSVGDDEGSIRETCPKIMQLDLSRNLLESLAPVIEVCRELEALRRLSINGNRFRDVLHDASLIEAHKALQGVKELELDETLLSWGELCHIATKCPSLTTFKAGTNQLGSLSSVNYGGLESTLTSLNLEYNDFTTFSDLRSLTKLTALRDLTLKGNNIKALAADGDTAPIFPPSLQFLDVSYNDIESWSFVDLIPTHFPGLTALRIAHNPVYDQQLSETATPSSEESHMFTIGRVAQLVSLNFTSIKAVDRANAEMFYLSRIAKQLATVPEATEHTVVAQHPRYAQLCEIYGAPDIIRREEIDPSFLEARLVAVGFHKDGAEKRTVRIPKSFDIYAVKGIVGKLFGLPPLRLRLIWETGEWDPVAGFDEVGNDDDDEEVAEKTQGGVENDTSSAEEEETRESSGRWIKREIELNDGPKQLGYCVDGLNVAVRVELP